MSHTAVISDKQRRHELLLAARAFLKSERRKYYHWQDRAAIEYAESIIEAYSAEFEEPAPPRDERAEGMKYECC